MTLARDELPFAFVTYRRLPSALTRTEVGYQPTGIRPIARLWPGCDTSKTATQLLSAFAT